MGASDARKTNEIDALQRWKQEQIQLGEKMRQATEQVKSQLEKATAEAENFKAADALKGREIAELRQYNMQKAKECSALEEAVAKKSKEVDELNKWMKTQL